MSELIYETVTTEDGNHRASVVLDAHSYDMKPDGDCYGTVLYQDTSYRGSVDVWCERYKSTDDWESVYADLWERRRDVDEIEAILRGRLNVCETCYRLLKYVESEGEWIANEAAVDADLYCIGREEGEFCEPEYDFSDNPVVGFDTVDLRDGKLINIVSLADLNTWGWETVEDFNEAMTKAGHEGDDPSRHNLDDFEAYANGDVYLVTVEEKVIEHIKITTLNKNEVIREIERETWEDHELGTLHGFYSVEHALEQAKEFIQHIEQSKGQEVAS